MNSKFCAKLQKSLEESVAKGDEVRFAFSSLLLSAEGENGIVNQLTVFDGNVSFLTRKV